ncbi:hypothetical protein F383_12417 [Gossypium arboreum]|uniref:Uncharacterized protein n=1 Tax=Gossypium arboreum TaxID=29729 RepID=A0A0B0N8Y1_GOSAR|nr:hypothetical protein F383_12550 [Gossypium arboreum]KHG28972.1 hypothetical protein F383_12417 [Gossypium arboreum]
MVFPTCTKLVLVKTMNHVAMTSL